MKIKGILCAGLLAACLGCGTRTAPIPAPDTSAKDQADIKALEDRFIAGFKARDLNAIMACYVPDESLVVFDVTPPRQYTGAIAYRKDFENFLGTSVGPIDATIGDLEVTTGGGDVAYGYSIQHVVAADKTGKKMAMTVRVTDGYKRINGHWLISHEHVSVPVDLVTMKPDIDSK